jgi:hypothetical protein
VELHDSSSGGGRSKASDSHEYIVILSIYLNGQKTARI